MMLKLSTFTVFLFMVIILQVLGKRKVKFFSRHHPDFIYCMDNYLFPRFFKTICPVKGEKWLKSRNIVQKEIVSPLLNGNTAKSFVKAVGGSQSDGSGSGDVLVREDFYNAYREECCHQGCRLEEALEFCNTLN